MSSPPKGGEASGGEDMPLVPPEAAPAARCLGGHHNPASALCCTVPGCPHPIAVESRRKRRAVDRHVEQSPPKPRDRKKRPPASDDKGATAQSSAPAAASSARPKRSDASDYSDICAAVGEAATVCAPPPGDAAAAAGPSGTAPPMAPGRCIELAEAPRNLGAGELDEPLDVAEAEAMVQAHMLKWRAQRQLPVHCWSATPENAARWKQARPAPFASRSLLRALLTPLVYHGPLYRRGRST